MSHFHCYDVLYSCITQHDVPVIATPSTFELVKDAVILIQCTELATKMLVHWVSLDGLGVHVQVPHFE